MRALLKACFVALAILQLADPASSEAIQLTTNTAACSGTSSGDPELACDGTQAQGQQLQMALDVDGAQVRSEANIAVEELKGMSESGVYETFRLGRILKAFSTKGRFFDIIVLEVELVSDMLHEPFITELTVMREDSETKELRSVSIDKLPNFPQDVVEEFQRRRKRAASEQRERTFERLERDYIRSTARLLEDRATEGSCITDLEALPSRLIRDLAALPDLDPRVKVLATQVLDSRLDSLLDKHEVLFSI